MRQWVCQQAQWVIQGGYLLGVAIYVMFEEGVLPNCLESREVMSWLVGIFITPRACLKEGYHRLNKANYQVSGCFG